MYVGPEPRKGRNVCPKPWKSSRLLKRRLRKDWRSSTVPVVEARTCISLISLCYVARNFYDWWAATTWSVWCPWGSPRRESVESRVEEVPLGLSHWGTFVCCNYLMFVLAPCGYWTVRWVCPGGTRRPAQSSGRGRRPVHDRGAKPVLTLLSIRAFRLILCQEIVKNQEHPRLDLFYVVGWVHPTQQ